jgi:hypothetical protein
MAVKRGAPPNVLPRTMPRIFPASRGFFGRPQNAHMSTCGGSSRADGVSNEPLGTAVTGAIARAMRPARSLARSATAVRVGSTSGRQAPRTRGPRSAFRRAPRAPRPRARREA